MLKKIGEITDHGKFIADAPLCFAVFGEKKEKYYLEDCCAATENLILALQAHGINSCWVAGEKKPYAETIRNLLSAALLSIRSEYVPIRDKAGEVQLRDINLYPKVDYYQSLVPGVIIMAIFLGTLTSGVFNLVMDRFLGIEESYLLTPLSKAHIVSGLVISGLSITTAIAAIITVASMLLTGIPLWRGVERFFPFLAVVVLTTLCLLSLMFVILGRARHPRIVGIISGFLNVILFFPSGAIYPVESFPGWLKTFAKCNPEVYAVHALKSILFKNAGMASISGDILFLSLFTIVLMTIAILTFKRTL